MSTLTTYFNLQKPEVGADDDVWGDMINEALDIIDAKLKALEIPIGGLYLSTAATDPATALGYGTWTAYAAGRALVGVGTADAVVWAGGDLKGAATHTLTASEMPSHTHSGSSLTAASGGSHTHSDTFSVASASLTGTFDLRRTNTLAGPVIADSGIVSYANGAAADATKLEQAGGSDPGQRVTINASHSHTLSGSISSGGAHTHSISGSTGSAGSGAAHNNIQPSIGIYVWQRTA